jgi:hypothetical protein
MYVYLEKLIFGILKSNIGFLVKYLSLRTSLPLPAEVEHSKFKEFDEREEGTAQEESKSPTNVTEECNDVVGFLLFHNFIPVSQSQYSLYCWVGTI